MIEYERIDISERIDVDKTNILHINFSYGPYLCDDYCNFSQKSIDFKNIAIVHIKKNAYRIYFPYMSKRKAKKLMTNSDLVDKMRIL